MKLKAGESNTFDCCECNSEFEVTLEPKAKRVPEGQKPKDEKEVVFCPFCGESGVDAQD